MGRTRRVIRSRGVITRRGLFQDVLPGPPSRARPPRGLPLSLCNLFPSLSGLTSRCPSRRTKKRGRAVEKVTNPRVFLSFRHTAAVSYVAGPVSLPKGGEKGRGKCARDDSTDILFLLIGEFLDRSGRIAPAAGKFY